MEKMKMQTDNLTDTYIAKIGEMFPEVLTEAKDENGNLKKVIDFAKLKQVLSSNLTEGKETYDFTWVGKNNAILDAATPTNKTLRPCKEESVNWDTTENLYIEGDNKDVLKLLQNSYMGKIKMIYIDPPYNTGNDFVYKDDFAQNKEDFDNKAGYVAEDGGRLVKNNNSNARFHSDWLNMMYPRLKLARNLLSDDGVIFISIDDNEVENLKKICDEIFGQGNRIETFNIQVRYANKSLNEKDDFQKLMEYVLIYAKQKSLFVPNKPFSEYDLSKFCYQIKELSPGTEITMGGKKVHIFLPGQYHIEKTKNYGIGYLKATWASGSVLKGNTSGKFFDNFLSRRKEIDGINILYKVFNIGEDGLGFRYFSGPKRENASKGQFYSGVPLERRELLAQGNTQKSEPIINFYDYSADFGNIRHEGGVAFNSGKKPIKMLKHFIEIANLHKDDIVLDFFSGSASTAHSIIQFNIENSKNYKFIMVQVPELTKEGTEEYKAGYKNICELGKERIRRVAKKIKEEHPEANFDGGFRVLKLADSNMKDVYYHPDQLSQDMLAQMTSNIKEDRTDLDLLYSCMLEQGVPLSSPYSAEQVENCTIHNVNNGDLLACFNENIPESVIRYMANKKPIQVVFRDNGFSSSPEKINVKEIFKLISPETKTIKVL